MGLAQKNQRLTPTEYLAIERAAPTKSEFYDGEMFAMAGGTAVHSLIGSNATIEFGNKLRGKKCVPYNADLRIQVSATGLFTYPDLSVICGPLQFADSDDTVTNPSVLVEVLSPSTEAYDRGQKFLQYRQIPTLREYLLVSQHEPLLELFVRQDTNLWSLREASGLDARLEIPSLEITVSLAEIYANVTFPPQPLRVVPGK
ncbi:MAG: Uma2 family endonuclease [Verrucomicrobia bacterium]|nr:Uma2 family endonuclease [Verrucomicrobiota bacterium]